MKRSSFFGFSLTLFLQSLHSCKDDSHLLQIFLVAGKHYKTPVLVKRLYLFLIWFFLLY